MSATHTPTPWRYQPRLSGSENHRGFSLRSENFLLADIMPIDEDGKEGEANAKFIVRAVNAYERDQETIKALETVLVDVRDGVQKAADASDRISGADRLQKLLWTLVDNANEALAQAKEAKP